MSLLMDALKKAEQAKRAQGQGETTAESPPETGLSLEQLEPSPASPKDTAREPPSSAEGNSKPAGGTRLPELPQQLEVLDHEFLAHVAKAPARPANAVERSVPTTEPPRPQAETASPRSEPPRATAANSPTAQSKPAASVPDKERAIAKAVFAAKQPAASDKKTFAIVVGVGTLGAVAGIGVYFWLQLQPAGGLKPIPQVVATAPRAVSPVAPTAAPALAATQAPATMPVATLPAVGPMAPSAPLTSPEPARTIAEAPTRTAAPARPATPRQAADADSPIRITTGKLKTHPSLVRGFDAFHAGDLAAAEAEYAKVLNAEPRNPDALHGMATIALRQGRYDQAEDYFLRAIEADPRDAIAQAGIVGLKGQVDAAASTSRLKSLLAAQPDQPFLHFALGNVYAGGQRWHEAQQAYFKAWAGDPDNPDYLFNLAVSLDHLRQIKLAAQYYNQALTAAAGRPAGFDKAQVAARLRDLQH